MQDDPLTRLGKEAGCSFCGTKGDTFYWLEYYILPTRLVRKRHRAKEIGAIYCRTCYEKDDRFHFEVDGKTYSTPKAPAKTSPQNLCVVCYNQVRSPKALYGVISSLLMMQAQAPKACLWPFSAATVLSNTKYFFPSKTILQSQV